MHWLIVVGLILLGLIILVVLAGVLAVKLAKQSHVDAELPLVIDGAPDTLKICARHWLPRFFSSFDVTFDGFAFMRGTIPAAGVMSSDEIQRWEMGHVIGHRVHQRREGDKEYWLSNLWQKLVQHRRNSEEEQFAYAAQHEIAAGTYPFVQCPSLPTMFPNNAQEPPAL